MKIQLSEADRARLGCGEWLDADLTSITVREAMALQPLGFGTPTEWREALRGDVVTDEQGEPVTLPDGRVARRAGREFPAALLALVWVALKRSGCQVGLDDLDFDMDAVDTRSDEVEVSGEGKDLSTPTMTSGS